MNISISETESRIKTKPGTNPLPSPVFSRHETFHPRFGWFKKGFDAAKKDSEVFLKEDAPVVLGVGKNMVRAIRYWCRAFKILEEKKSPHKNGKVSSPTEFGRRLLQDWDPYLEDPSSLWLLHWYLVKPPSMATAWHFTFNAFHQNEFTSEDLVEALSEYTTINYPNSRIVRSSLEKDVNCILRMYVHRSSSKGAKEDSLNCPFDQLKLIEKVGNSKFLRFNIGKHGNLPPEIAVAICLEYASDVSPSARTINLSSLLYNSDSPGNLLKWNEHALSDAIEQVSKSTKNISISDTAGVTQLVYKKEPSTLSTNLIEKYYTSASRWEK